MLGVFLLPALTRLGHGCQDLLSPCYEMQLCAQTRPRFIRSSERVLREWSQNPCLLQGKTPLYQKENSSQRRIEPTTVSHGCEWTDESRIQTPQFPLPRWAPSHLGPYAPQGSTTLLPKLSVTSKVSARTSCAWVGSRVRFRSSEDVSLLEFTSPVDREYMRQCQKFH